MTDGFWWCGSQIRKVRGALIAFAFLSAATPAFAMDLKFDKNTAIIIWRCGEVAMAQRLAKASEAAIQPMPDYCVSIGQSIGELPADKPTP